MTPAKQPNQYAQRTEPLAFGQRRIGASEPVLIIAEIGVNHEGDAEVCTRMIGEAAKAGADAIKLQTMDADENYVPGTESHTLFSNCALSEEETAHMFDMARDLNLDAFTTCGDARTLEWVDRLNPAAHKISSGLLTHTPMIGLAARTGRTLLMSTGMATEEDVDEAVAMARRHGPGSVGLFQCTSVYPAPPEAMNLAGIAWLNHRYGVPAGLSDHSDGVDAAALSVAAGARMIEKHFTLDRTRPSYDHRLSLEPDRFATMVGRVREAETMLGAPGLGLSGDEQTSRRKYHRCLVARRSIESGEALDATNVCVKRPLPDKRGLEPKHFDAVIGRRTTRALAANEPITPDILVDSR